MSDDRNSMGGFNNSPANGLGNYNAGTQWDAGVNIHDSPISAQIKVGIYNNNKQQQEINNSRRHRNGGAGNYDGSYESQSGPSMLNSMFVGFIGFILKSIAFLLKVMFYYMPKYHTKTFLVFVLGLAALCIINSPQVDQWNSDSQKALQPRDIRPLPFSTFGIAEEAPSKIKGFKSLMTANDFDNRALFAMYLRGFNKGNNELNQIMVERVLRDRLLFNTPEPIMSNMPKSVAKNLHREALTVRETAEFNAISCEAAEKFVTTSFPNMNKTNLAKAKLERALLQFNKKCSINNRYPAKWAEYLLRDSKSELDSVGLDLLNKIHKSPAFIFNKYNKGTSALLTMLLLTLLTWVSFRRDCGKEKKTDPEVVNSTTHENPVDFSLKP